MTDPRHESPPQATGYDVGLRAARSSRPQAPAEPDSSRLAEAMLSARKRVILRRKLAFWLTVALAGYFAVWTVAYQYWYSGDWRWGLMLSGGFLLSVLTGVAAYGISRSSVGWQLFARTILIAHVVSELFPLTAGRTVVVFELGPVFLSLCILALAGRDRLGPDGGPFSPIRFRRLLIAAILVNGVLGCSRLTGVVHRMVFELGLGDPYPFWEPILTNFVLGAAFVVAAVGLYRLLAVALLVPLGVALFFAYRGVFGAAYYRFDDEGVSRGLSTEFAWGWFRMGSIIALTVAPILYGLLRLRMRKDRQ